MNFNLRPAVGWKPTLLTLAFGLGLSSIVWTSVIVATTDDLDREVEAKQRDNANLALALKEHTERVIQTVDTALLSVQREAATSRPDRVELQQIARATGMSGSGLLRLAVTDTRGRITASSAPGYSGPADAAPAGDAASTNAIDVSDREYFTTWVTNPDNVLHVSPILDQRLTGTSAITLTRPVVDRQGRFQGIAIAALSPDHFAEIYGHVDIGPQGLIALAHLDGAPVISLVIDGKPKPLPIDKHTILSEQARVAREGQYRVKSPVDGIERLFTFRALETAPLVLAIGSPVASVIESQQRRRNSYYTIAATFTLMLFILGSVFLRVWQRQIVSGARSDARRQLLANVSHEIRTPMNGVLGVSELLLEEPLDQRHHELVETLHRSANELLRLVDDILDFSKLDSGMLRTENIAWSPGQAVADCVALMRASAERKGIQIGTTLAEGVPAIVTGDPYRVRQILLNLCSNAIKFTDHGTVTLSLSARMEGEGRCLLRFDVLDTGIGMSAQALAHVFDPFNQASASTTRRYGGTGLGLSISRDLARLMGGDITAKSREGKGARFSFTLPAWIRSSDRQLPPSEASVAAAGALPSETETETRPASPTLESSPEQQAQPLADLTVLVAEDNAVNQEVLTAMLSSLGCRVTLAHDGHEALEAIARTPFDIVLMDCQMPGLDGLAATRLIREKESGTQRHLPIVAVTASATIEERARCLDAGMDDVLAKPYRRAALALMLTRHAPRAQERQSMRAPDNRTSRS